MVDCHIGNKWYLTDTAEESSGPLSMPGHVSAPDEELSWCHKEKESACDVIQMATLTFSIKRIDRLCVMKL